VVDGEGFEPRLSCRELDIAEAIRERIDSSFYISRDTFGAVSIPIRFVSDSVAVVGTDAREIRCAIDENRGFNRVAAVVKLVEKSPRRPLP
jgi:L-rhamnose isomerase